MCRGNRREVRGRRRDGCVRGADRARGSRRARALHCALAIWRRPRALFHGELALRIGVNTGEVVVGRPREGSSFVSGDAVNVGARLDQAASADEILVGGRTVALVCGAFDFGASQSCEAKGKTEGVVGAPLAIVRSSSARRRSWRTWASSGTRSRHGIC